MSHDGVGQAWDKRDTGTSRYRPFVSKWTYGQFGSLYIDNGSKVRIRRNSGGN